MEDRNQTGPTSCHCALLHKELTDLDVKDKVGELRSDHDPLRTPTAMLHIHMVHTYWRNSNTSRSEIQCGSLVVFSVKGSSNLFEIKRSTTFHRMGRDGSVGIATTLRAGRSGDRMLAWGARFSAPVQTGPGAYPA